MFSPPLPLNTQSSVSSGQAAGRTEGGQAGVGWGWNSTAKGNPDVKCYRFKT